MKSSIRLLVYSLFILSLLYACEKKEIPTILTDEIDDITATTATCGGIITDEGSSAVIARGVCWSTEADPTIDDDKTSDGNGGGVFSSSLSDLFGATTYHVRAYATNNEGTGYGSDMSFTTLGSQPAATTLAASDITTTSATLNGTVNPNYLSTTVTFEYGLTTSYGNTTIGTESISGYAIFNVSEDISDLSPGTTYHFRVKAVNELGTTFGVDMTFTTLGDLPIAKTQHATNITTTGATLNGTVNANYLSTIITVEYGTTTSYDSTIVAALSPLNGNADIKVLLNISGLLPGTTYHFRVSATNELGTTYGGDMEFTTLGAVPTVSGQTVTTVKSYSVVLNGIVNANHIDTEVIFEYGTTTIYGFTITPSTSSVSGDTDTNISADLSGLTENTTYHFRIRAENSLGVTYGNDLTFTTMETVSDYEENEYVSVKIGDQIWMSENLMTIYLNDGTPIPNVIDDGEWYNLVTPGYAWYNHDEDTYKDDYGALYNWYTVNTGKLCPSGWHVPSDDEFITLIEYLADNVANKLKETGTTHWVSPNSGATDESGFSGLPGGWRFNGGGFSGLNYYGRYWTSTEFLVIISYARLLDYGNNEFYRNNENKTTGFSVRCVKD